MEKKIDDEQPGDAVWPILTGKDYLAPSVFRPDALLREARRQKSLPLVSVPAICVLDPDGDVVRHLKQKGVGRVHEGWACYHTELIIFEIDGIGDRAKTGYSDHFPPAVLAEALARETQHLGQWIDSSAMDVEQVVDAILDD